jgi:methylglutaconyl-CoA hydratase
MTPSSTLVQLDSHDEAISILTLNRPDKRNALNLDLIEQITVTMAQVAADVNRRVLIVRGAGPSLCAGLDLTETSQPLAAERSAAALAKMYETLCDSPLVTIAASHGNAVGGGAGLVLACDFVVAAEDLKLGFPEVHRGLVAALVTTILRRQVNDRTARELVLLGQTIDARRAVDIGLVNRAVPCDRLMDEAIALARQACLGAPNAIVRSKRLLDDFGARPIRKELRRALKYHLEARHSSEAQEGMRAFAEKRAPAWGRRDAGSG